MLALLIAARAAAPYLVKSAINDRLRRVPDYSGHVRDVDLGLWRGAYVLQGVDVRKRSAAGDAPFFSARRVDFSIAWRELWHGRLVGDVAVDHGRLMFVKAATPQASQLETDRRWQDAIQDVFPIEITHLEVNDGDLHFVDHTHDPDVDVSVHDMHLVATGLRNRKRTSREDVLPAAISVDGTTIGDGRLRLLLRLAPLAREPLFDLDLAVERVTLPALNDFLLAYANVDVSRGTFDLYLEVAARDGAFRGYVKPFFRNLDFENRSDKHRPLLGKIWESVVNFMDNILKNPDKHQLGTRVPFSGTFENTNVGTVTGILNAVRYGFGAAFSEKIDERIEPSDVKAGPGKSK